MQTVKDSVTQERNRLEAAFLALENSIETYVEKLEMQAKSKAQSQFSVSQVPAATQSSSPAAGNGQNAELLSQIQEIVKSHERKIVELKEEIGRLSVDLVRLKEENRALKDQNKQAAELIGESITAIEKLVAA